MEMPQRGRWEDRNRQVKLGMPKSVQTDRGKRTGGVQHQPSKPTMQPPDALVTVMPRQVHPCGRYRRPFAQCTRSAL
jgi:hypothetical protein